LTLSNNNKRGETILRSWPCCCCFKYIWSDNENLWGVGFNREAR